ncbi:hypothetical protein [Arthrobacter sp. NicSoilB8]|uniref:hypothetical protein n=1 Tax=Arthrobacter sp. NicSoilB8 TaxID=2830998 RepID=UPI001CC74503|nr:hypothetical protein [Arthrobacter sp. NicSoilB8]
MTGSSPAADTRFGSSKETDTADGLWETCTYEALLFSVVNVLETSSIFLEKAGISV